MNPFMNKQCRPYSAQEPILSIEQIKQNLLHITCWELLESEHCLYRAYQFSNYHQTISFVNALAWVAHQQDHHPELTVHYNRCEVRYKTHSIDGITENDFICASLIDQLISG